MRTADLEASGLDLTRTLLVCICSCATVIEGIR